MIEAKFTLDETDADTILRLKAATLRAQGYTGAVAVSISRLYELHADDCCGYVRMSLIIAQYDSRFGQ